MAFIACGGLALLAGITPQRAQAQGVGVSLHLDAESVELIRAWRRAQGLDPPDPAADARLAEWLAARRAAARPQPVTTEHPRASRLGREQRQPPPASDRR
jgi:hypothetical protein